MQLLRKSIESWFTGSNSNTEATWEPLSNVFLLTGRQLRQLDVLVLVLWCVIAVGLSVTISASYFTSTLLFFGMPALYLSLRSPHAVSISTVFSLAFALPLTTTANYVAIVSKAWATVTVLPVKFLSVMPYEDFVWGTLVVYVVVIFYMHFFAGSGVVRFNTRIRGFIVCMVSIMAAFFLLYFLQPSWLVIPYAYLIIGIAVSGIPTAILLFIQPHLLETVTKTASFFFFLTLLFELTAIELGQWTFPGTEFIGMVELIGYRFPIEEMLFYMLLVGPAGIAFFRFLTTEKQ